mmetsp:Transcript_3912/g.9339  ORF Transcript_3912/g.9339 Transcript_3912/m.9339 type:complete len:223 (+) Transcript_3912:3166-3834(+)
MRAWHGSRPSVLRDVRQQFCEQAARPRPVAAHSVVHAVAVASHRHAVQPLLPLAVPVGQGLSERARQEDRRLLLPVGALQRLPGGDARGDVGAARPRRRADQCAFDRGQQPREGLQLLHPVCAVPDARHRGLRHLPAPRRHLVLPRRPDLPLPPARVLLPGARCRHDVDSQEPPLREGDTHTPPHLPPRISLLDGLPGDPPILQRLLRHLLDGPAVPHPLRV